MRTASGIAAALAAAAALVVVVLVIAPGSRSGENPYSYDIPAMDRARGEALSYAESAGFEPGLRRLAGLCVLDDDRIVVVGDACLSVFGPDGKKTGSLDLPESPTCVSAFRAGCFAGPGPASIAPYFVGLTDRVILVSAGGAVESEWSPLGENAFVTSIAVGPSTVCVADAGNRVVWAFDRAGKMLSILGRSGEGFVVPSPYFDLALDRNAALWVANPGERRIERFDASFDRASMWGKSSMEIDGFCGCCNPSHFAIGPSGNFFTAEKGIPRVKEYTADGVFVAVVADSSGFDESTIGLDIAVDSKGRVIVLDPKRGKVRVFEKMSGTQAGR